MTTTTKRDIRISPREVRQKSSANLFTKAHIITGDIVKGSEPLIDIEDDPEVEDAELND